MMDAYDDETPTLERASLDRIARMRTRAPRSEPAPRAVFPWVLAAILLAFALGLIANPWFERNIRSHLPGFAAETLPTVADVTAQRAQISALQAQLKALAARPTIAGAAGAVIGGERLMHAETRLDGIEQSAGQTAAQADELAQKVAALGGRVDATASATQAVLASAAQGAESAQSVLLLSMTRRLLDNGDRLTVVEPALQRNFGARFAAPVAAIVALGNAPVTLRSLRADLVRLRPSLATEAGADPSWWDNLTASLSSIVRIRETGTAPTAPADRVDAALLALAGGNVEAARTQIAGLPAAPKLAAKPWLAAAARYQAAQQALLTLETAALAPAGAVGEAPFAPVLSPKASAAR